MKSDHEEAVLAELDRYKRSLKEARTKEWADICIDKINALKKELRSS